MQQTSPFTISFIMPGGNGITVFALNSKMAAALAGLLALGLLVVALLAAAVLAGIGYIVVKVALLTLGLLTAIVTAPLFIGLLIPTAFMLICLVLVWMCAKYLWCSLFPRKAATA